ncbi:MAG TPA: DUF1259 domain-containing protein [Terriglobales bacterium]|nr:DUF1259 domain-containing protein [Terriglobales bacterium]
MRCDKIRLIAIGLVMLVLALAPASAWAQAESQGKADEWKLVEAAMGRPGKLQPDGAFKFSMPRKDLKVTVDGTPIQPGLALGSWVAIAGTPGHAMAMGDLVLTEDEIGPVMLKLQQEGIQQTAVHNHLLHETPRVMYMHIAGHGDAVKMAKAIHDALALTKTPPSESGPATSAEQNLEFDTAQIDATLGHKGKVNGGIFQVGVPRSEKIIDEGMEVPPSMGTATSLNFQPTGNGRAAVTGDFVLLADEVNPVLKTLRDHGIQVTALHSHMLHDQPHLFFMHFWANDDAVKLARGLRAALDKTASKK